ncbi:hypothetical protein OF83DRAFT_1161287 [Amylostereum chailletii]|nr:hypothetical protein OF83DRAFT_1161287 [Amylostereum chailletii]
MSINMTTDHPQNIASMSRPSSRPSAFIPGQKRSATLYPQETSFASGTPTDSNHWYYPACGAESDDEVKDYAPDVSTSNWGRKSNKGARWMRKGKLAAWGPGIEEWEAEDRARKRVKMMVSEEERSPSPPTLPHLRSPSPPLTAPYPVPETEQNNWTAFVMDRAVTHSFRSHLLQELEHTTNGLIEGEAGMKRALGKLWQVLSEDPDRVRGTEAIVPKREDEDGDNDDDESRRIARGPDLTPPVHKIFLVPYGNGNGNGNGFEASHFAQPETQAETLEKSLAALREFRDDRREYVERLEEIREGLGDARAQRDAVWRVVRTNAVKELQTMATESEV